MLGEITDEIQGLYAWLISRGKNTRWADEADGFPKCANALRDQLAARRKAEEINMRYRTGLPTASRRMEWTDAQWQELADRELKGEKPWGKS